MFMFYSPLRYPGGKGKLASLMELLIIKSGHEGGTYIEPFAGGAGVALELLEKEVVNDIVINDYDKGIYSFWRAILTETERFLNELDQIPLNIDEWENQRNICMNENQRYSFELGFSTFYLNRTNRSGIIKGGVIGGNEQNGDWRLDARFNKDELAKRIIKISKRKKNIHLYNKDIESFITNYVPKYDDNTLIYFDPPYYKKGKQLYMNFFEHSDHERIERSIRNQINCDWVVTYDNVDEIKEIYHNHIYRIFDLNYSVANKRRASEIIFFENERMIPTSQELVKKDIKINLR